MNIFFVLFILTIAKIHADNFSDLPWISGHHGLELEIIQKFLPTNPVILEAGAHYGEDTINFIKRWPQATVYAFEPCPQYYAQLKKTTQPYTNIHTFPIGLFSKTGTYTFYVSSKWDGASSLLEDNHLSQGLDYHDRPIQVFCQNLDEWAEENKVSHIDYMWLDMEGAELFMLNAAPKILRTVKAISAELNFREYRKNMTMFLDLYNFLLDNNFQLFKIWGSPLGQATGVFIKN